MDLVSLLAFTGRLSMPRIRLYISEPNFPNSPVSCPRVRLSISSTVYTPMLLSFCDDFPPMPYTLPTGRGRRISGTMSFVITISPSGLFQSDASLAKNLLYDTPADTVREVLFNTSCLIDRATETASSPVTSRYASSMESGCIIFVYERNMPNTAPDTSWYLACRVGR